MQPKIKCNRCSICFVDKNIQRKKEYEQRDEQDFYSVQRCCLLHIQHEGQKSLTSDKVTY